MKEKFYNLIKAKGLLDDDASKNWLFIVYIVFLAIIMIYNTHNFEKKVYEISALGEKSKDLRSEFVDVRSELMELKMESTISELMEDKGIYPSTVPPQKIKVSKTKGWFSKLWE